MRAQTSTKATIKGSSTGGQVVRAQKLKRDPHGQQFTHSLAFLTTLPPVEEPGFLGVNNLTVGLCTHTGRNGPAYREVLIIKA